MKEISDWIEKTYLKFAEQEKNIRVAVQMTFYKGTFSLMFMKFSLVVST